MNYFKLNSNLGFFQHYETNIIIDEAQEYPELFKILRGVVDQNRSQKGRFILTGSSSPLLHQHLSQSLAGRSATLQLSTLKANECYNQPLSPFYDLFQSKLNAAHLPTGNKPLLTTDQMQNHWLYGGYPEPTLAKDKNFYYRWMQEYYATYINRDIKNIFPRLNAHAYQRFINILGTLSSTIINRSDVARALEVNEKSIREYLQIAAGTFLWRELPSYEHSAIKSIVKLPKGHFQDSGLLHYLLKINSLESLYNHAIVGRSFETFVIEEILKGLSSTNATNWKAHYYRTRGGIEIDLILEGYFGILPIEIKYGSTVKQKQLKNLEGFILQNNLPLGFVINQSTEITWLTEKILQLPVGWL